MSLTPQYALVSGKVLEVLEYEGEYLAEHRYFFKKNNTLTFDTKEEAMYAKLVQELRCGKSLSNFKGSPYYEYYVEQLKIHNPEYIL